MTLHSDMLPGVDVHTVDLSTEPIMWTQLSHEEMAGRFRSPLHRRRFLARRSALRRILGMVLGCAPGSLVMARDENGRPCVSGCNFNLSHCGDLAVIAVVQDGGAMPCVGIDVERDVVPPEADAMVAGFFSSRERWAWSAMGRMERRRAFMPLWTRKEAVAKSVGGIKALPFARFTADLERERAVAEPPDHRSWALASWRPAPCYQAALAVMQTC